MARSRGAAWPVPRLARPRPVRRRSALGLRSRGVRRGAPGHRSGRARRPTRGHRSGHGRRRGHGHYCGRGHCPRHGRRCGYGHRLGHGRRCGCGRDRGCGHRRGSGPTMRAGRRRRGQVRPPGHVAAARWRRRVRGSADPTGRRRPVEGHVYGARSCRRRPGARRTGASKNPRPCSRRRRNASYRARWDGGSGRPGRIRRHRDRQHLCYVRPHHRRPSAEHSRSGCRAANRPLMRVVPAGSRTGS